MLKIYNTLTKKKEQLKNKDLIKIYTCGITVYDYCHIGHARIFLFFDTLIRYLNFLKIKVIFIRNITDIDDKIINTSLKKKKSINHITRIFIKKMHNDTKKLNIIDPSFEPKATKFIQCMINLIENLKYKNYAYDGKNNDIYFNVNKNINYGILSKRKLEASVETNKNTQNKKNISDFVLWKSEKNNIIKWNSPWGLGRPGWHTECSAMSMYYSKDYIDIHGGGYDLLFPHHENELSQCDAIDKKKFVKIWMHIGFLKIQKQKMSKSLQNHILIKNILKKYKEEHIRFFFLLTHYRKKIDYSEKNMEKSKNILEKIYKLFISLKEQNTINTQISENFINALNDDLNTPKALTFLFINIKKIKNKNPNNTQSIIYTIKYLGNIIGIFKDDPKTFIKKNITTTNEKINFFIKKRNIARKEKNWNLADKIRKKLKTLGITLEDQKNGDTLII